MPGPGRTEATVTSIRPGAPAAGRSAAQWLWDHRDPMAPIWCTAGALTAAAAIHAGGDPLWAIAPPALYAATAAWRIDRDNTRGFARTRTAWVFHGTVAASFGVWMIPASIGGLTLTLLEAAGAGLLTFGGAWWSRRRLWQIRAWSRQRRWPWWWLRKAPELEAAAEPAELPARQLSAREQLVQDWHTYLNTNNGPLAGVRLTDLEELTTEDGRPYALRAHLIGVRGKHTTDRLLASAETIRSGLSAKPGTVIMDGTATTGESARMTLLTGDSPLRHVDDFEAPEVGDRDPNKIWRAKIGQFADGTGIYWTYYVPNSGAEHGILAADSGWGKGVTSDKIVIGAVALGAVVLYLDPKDGRSSSVLPLISGVAATVEERRLLIKGIKAEMRRRNAAMANQPWTDQYGNRRNTIPGTDPPSFFTPTPDMPLLYVLADEIATQVEEDSEYAAEFGPIVREARACGIGVLVIGQGIGVAEVGGATIRAQVAKNIIMLHTRNALTGQRLGDTDLLLDPHDLPTVWPGTQEPAKGLCVPAGLCAAGRAEMGRISPNGNLVPIVEQLLPTRSTLTATARMTLGLDELAELRQARLAGRRVVQVPASTPTPNADNAPAGHDDSQPEAADVPDDAGIRDLVLHVLRNADGPMATADILQQVNNAGRAVSPSALGNHMGKLISSGDATRIRHGHYQAATSSR